MPDAAGESTLVSAPLGITCIEHSHSHTSNQCQTGQTTSNNDTGGTDPHCTGKTMGSRTRDRLSRRWRICRGQPGSYLPSVARPLCLTLVVDSTTLRSSATTAQGQTRGEAEERSPATEADAAFNEPGDSLALSRDPMVRWTAAEDGRASWHSVVASRWGGSTAHPALVLLRDPSGKRSPFA